MLRSRCAEDRLTRRTARQWQARAGEKPLWAADDAAIGDLESLARRAGAVCYTAYNHRFEPHFVRMRDLIASGKLGRIYRCRMFYGNGTARLVRDSAWRDHGSGVLHDLGSHLLDTLRFWFGAVTEDFVVTASHRFENRSPDHVVIGSAHGVPSFELEMTLLSWRNHFTCDVFAEHGSAHIESLCKWGPSRFVERTRVLPSGRPPEAAVTLVEEDPTWAANMRIRTTLRRAGRDRPVDRSVAQRATAPAWRNRDRAGRRMTTTVGFVGMTHLGLVSASATAAQGLPHDLL